MVVRKPQLSFVLPAYNEEGSIEGVLLSADRVAEEMGLSHETIVVDDGSIDRTRELALAYATNNGHVRVLQNYENSGKGFAVKRGFLEAKGNYVVFVDSDREISLERIESYVKNLRSADIVIASRWHPQSRVKMPLTRRLLSHSFNVLVKLATGIRVRDTQTGLKAVKRGVFVEVFRKLSVKRFAFDVELLILANHLGLRVVELPVDVRMGGSFELREIWRMFIDLLGITYRLRITRWYDRVLQL